MVNFKRIILDIYKMRILQLLVIVLLILNCSAPENVKVKYELNDFQKGINIDSLYHFNYGLDKFEKKASYLIVNWNIQQGRYLEEQIKFLKTLDPDIICLQEVDWHNERSKYHNVIDIMSKKLKMNSCFATEFLEIESDKRRKCSFVGQGGGIIGNAILSKTRLYNCKRLPLTDRYFNWQDINNDNKKIIQREPRIGQRIALFATTKIDTIELTVVTTHLEDKGGGIKGRVEQLDQILMEIEKAYSKHAIICGDLNSYAHGAALLLFRQANDDSITHAKPFWQPEAEWLDKNIISKTLFIDPFDKIKEYTVRHSIFYRGKLDWILLKNLEVVDRGMSKDIEFSDHKALWVYFRFFPIKYRRSEE